MLTSILLFISIFAFHSQKTIYFDKDWKVTKKQLASYYREITKEGNNIYAVKDNYLNGVLQMSGYYQDAKLEVKNGQFNYFDSTGNKSLISHYSNGKLNGEFIRYYPDGAVRQNKIYSNGKSNGAYLEYYNSGKLRAEGNYTNGKIRGEWKRYYESGAILCTSKIDDQGSGSFNSLYQNGSTWETGEFVKDSKTGFWAVYNENGQKIENKDCGPETIDNLKINEVLFDKAYILGDLKDNNIIEYPEKDARFIGGLTALSDYIVNNLNYPEKAIKKNVQGKVIISFVVETDGSISNVEVIEGHKLLRQESIRIVQSMPKWYPGEFNDRKARTRCKLPLNFTLD